MSMEPCILKDQRLCRSESKRSEGRSVNIVESTKKYNRNIYEKEEFQNDMWFRDEYSIKRKQEELKFGFRPLAVIEESLEDPIEDQKIQTFYENASQDISHYIGKSGLNSIVNSSTNSGSKSSKLLKNIANTIRSHTEKLPSIKRSENLIKSLKNFDIKRKL